MVSRHLTMPVTCSTSRALNVLRIGDRRGKHIGHQRNRGRLDLTLASASRMASAAGCISAQWKGALTGSSTARRAPNFGAKPTARSIAVLAPEITTWPGALSLAASHTSPSAAALGQLLGLAEIGAEQRRHRPFAHRHRLLHGAAACLEQPRRIGEAERAGSGKRRIFAERMAGDIGHACRRASSPLSPSTRIAANDTAISAGCAFSVSVSSASGPSHISRDRCCDSAASTSSNTARAEG